MSDAPEYRCFVGGLSWSTSDRTLEDVFHKFGYLIEEKVVVGRDASRSRGFGFVIFDDKKSMEDAIDSMHGMSLDGHSITVDRARTKSDGEDHGDRGAVAMVVEVEEDILVVEIQSALNVVSMVILRGNALMEMDIREVEVIDMEEKVIIMEVVVGVVNMALITMVLIGMEDTVGTGEAVEIVITMTVLVMPSWLRDGRAPGDRACTR